MLSEPDVERKAGKCRVARIRANRKSAEALLESISTDTEGKYAEPRPHVHSVVLYHLVEDTI